MAKLIRYICIFVVMAASIGATACLSCMDPLRGTYTDQTGGLVLDLKGGGNATFTFAGQPAACNYSKQGNRLTVKCNGDAGTTTFTIDKDGRLLPPPGSLFSPLTTKK
jgi:hypothetical protein